MSQVFGIGQHNPKSEKVPPNDMAAGSNELACTFLYEAILCADADWRSWLACQALDAYG